MQIQESEKFTLWVDDSDKTQQAKELLKKAGIDYEAKTLDQAGPNDFKDILTPPTLQTHVYRYSGVSGIEAFCTEGIRDCDDLQYIALVECEERMKDRFPNGIPGLWPRWSSRCNC